MAYNNVNLPNFLFFWNMEEVKHILTASESTTSTNANSKENHKRRLSQIQQTTKILSS
jgi:hypothetical protein